MKFDCVVNTFVASALFIGYFLDKADGDTLKALFVVFRHGNRRCQISKIKQSINQSN